MNMENLDRFKGCLVGLSIGDMLGFPYETMTSAEIKALVPEIKEYVEPVQRNISDTIKLSKYSYTDDTQLAIAVAQSIIDSGGFDLTDMALKHVEAMDTSIAGWGKSTYDGIKQLKTFFDSRGRKGRSPVQSLVKSDFNPKEPSTKGCGNGVAMKIAPLVLWLCASKQSYHDAYVMNVAGLTHSDARAGVVACYLANEIIKIFKSHQIHNDYLNDDYYCATVSINEKMRLVESAKSVDELYNTVGPGFFALESVPFAIGMSRLFRNDFRQAINQTILSGGDCDSTASMVGAIVGANVGMSGIPKEWILPFHEEKMIPLAELLYKTALDGRPKRLTGGFVRIS
jgi:ADP-ribosyl-[dinitrogen reductase] hydrolase